MCYLLEHYIFHEKKIDSSTHIKKAYQTNIGAVKVVMFSFIDQHREATDATDVAALCTLPC